jgi:hypothetical protein
LTTVATILVTLGATHFGLGKHFLELGRQGMENFLKVTCYIYSDQIAYIPRVYSGWVTDKHVWN